MQTVHKPYLLWRKLFFGLMQSLRCRPSELSSMIAWEMARDMVMDGSSSPGVHVLSHCGTIASAMSVHLAIGEHSSQAGLVECHRGYLESTGSQN